MQVQVVAVFLDDEGAPVWNYNHIEVVPDNGDIEQALLEATGMLHDHLDHAKTAIGVQADAGVKTLRERREEGGMPPK